jgi:hypothetical protein
MAITPLPPDPRGNGPSRGYIPNVSLSEAYQGGSHRWALDGVGRGVVTCNRRHPFFRELIMHAKSLALALVICGVLASGDAGARQKPAKPKPLGGWPGVFPKLLGYSRTFTAPAVEDGKKPKKYSQRVKYEWTGGAARLLEVTLARDPAFKDRHAEATLAKDPGEPRQVKVGKRTGWLWDLNPEGDKDPWALRQRLVVPLGEDRAVIFEAKGPGPWGKGLHETAKSFDLGRLEKALDAPPRTDFRRRLDAFRALRKGMSYDAVTDWVGFADRDIGSGIHIMEYVLDDGSRVLLGFPDFNRLVYVRHAPKGGKAVDLVK